MEVQHGTLTTCSLSEVKNLNLDQYDVKLFIARHAGKVMQSLSSKGFVHVPELAPSAELIKRSMQDRKISVHWKKTLEEGYITEISSSVKYIDRIETHLLDGKNVLLCCYCKEDSDCHRSMLKNILEIRLFFSDLFGPNNQPPKERNNESKT